ncbi:ATP-binding protein [Marinibaculum pumilum]|uniref:histidine kinase n=1 Tax=Marinibaculum pumilum TaxID=1766165 RepID=A0ABV7L9J4_9PROT
MRLSTKLFLAFLPAVIAVMAGLFLVAIDAFEDGLLRGHHAHLERVLTALQQVEAPATLPPAATKRDPAQAEPATGAQEKGGGQAADGGGTGWLSRGIGDHLDPDPGTREGALALAWQQIVLREERHLTVLRSDGTLIMSTMRGGRDYEALWRDLLDGRNPASPPLAGVAPLPGRSVPYVAGGYPAYGWMLVVSAPRDTVALALKRLEWWILGIGAALSMLLLGLAWLLARRLILRPVAVLERAAGDIAAQRQVQRIPVRGRDELAALARALEEMAADLAAAFGAVRRERDMNAVLMSSAPAAVAVLDADRRILQCNGRFAQAFGAAAVSRPIAEMVAAPAERQEAEAHFADTRPPVREFQLPGGADSAVFAWTIAPLPPGSEPSAPGMAAPAFIATGLDVTARHRAEAARRALQAELEHRERLETLGTFAGGIAHDLNNILTPVVGYVRMAEERLQAAAPAEGAAEDDAALADYLERIRRAADRARYVIRQILTFGRKVGPEAELMDLAEAVGDSLDLELPESETGIALVRDLPDDAAARPMVNADPVQLHQVLSNLISNARHAMPEGGEIRVSVGVEQEIAGKDGPWALLQVSDSGTGMPAEVAARIFEPFYTTKRTGRGTGLGLSVVHGIVGAHGGRIDVTSRPGAGTTFAIRLPLAGTVAAPGAAAPVPTARPADEDGHEVALPPGLRVLVVDDETEPRELALAVLVQAGCRARGATGGAEALALLQGEPAAAQTQLLLTDLTMPGMGGRELAAEVGRRRPGLPVVAMTGGPQEPEAADRFAAWLAKPFAPEDLRAALGRALAGKRMQG